MSRLAALDGCVLFQSDFPNVRERYLALLRQLVDLLRKRLGENLVSVYLLGSPGRGHATLFRRNGAWELAHDLDLQVVVRQALQPPALDALADACTRAVNPAHRWVKDAYSEVDFRVDVSQVPLGTLGFVGPTMHAADFAYGGLLLHGPEVRHAIRFGLGDIPLIEACLLLYNRLCSMIETVEVEYFEAGTGPKSPAWDITLYFAKKGIIDGGAAVLIGHGTYTPDYCERANRLQLVGPLQAERYRWWVREGALVEPEALDGQALVATWREGYEALRFAREQLRLPDLSRPDGSLSPRGALHWWRVWYRGEHHLRRWGSGRQPVRWLKGLARQGLLAPTFLDRLRAYASAEWLVQRWSLELASACPNSDLAPWYERRRATVSLWKRSGHR